MPERKIIVVPREVLLFEIDRHCSFDDCGARALVGLTKAEALGYRGFECVRCRRWNDDRLSQRDIPEWWGEINVDGVSKVGL
jgi:hypothetical protein